MSDVALLAEQLQDEAVESRAAAAEQLSHLADGARTAAVALVKACADEETVSQWAVAALEELGPPPEESAGELTVLAADANGLVAYWSITLLGRLGTAAGGAVDALAAVLASSPEAAVRQRSAWSLGNIGVTTPNALSALQQASQDADPRLSQLAVQALAKLQ